ncbi:hypothetical protein FQN55_000373 [Onygenales sp. PD_40]|nr:hypothetical protein FQN55_000373 [Onygenales sp. PD_40]
MSDTDSSHFSDWEEDLPDDVRLRLPGFTMPLNWDPTARSSSIASPRPKHGHRDPRRREPKPRLQGIQRGRFPTALSYQDALDHVLRCPVLTNRENTMVQAMNEITDKAGWNDQVFDDITAESWRKEMVSGSHDISEAMAKWVIDELRYKTRIFHEYGLVDVFNGGVVKSDTAIPDSLNESFCDAVRKLENVPADQKDYHPGTNQTVVDLVHPSLYPLIYGRSRILSEKILGLDDCVASCGLGDTLLIPANEYAVSKQKTENRSRAADRYRNLKLYSQRYQWLPCNVEFLDKEGSHLRLDQHEPSKVAAASISAPCRITSYINNLHPDKNKDLYALIEQVIASAIPLWNRSLSALNAEFTRRINYDKCVREKPLSPAEMERAKGSKPKRPVTKSGYVLPDPGKFEPIMTPSLSPGSVDLQRQFRKSGLQVIVKMASIHLTPENPKYNGGSWHIEGQLNEHICATALYYIDTHNITPSHLTFRQQCTTNPTPNLSTLTIPTASISPSTYLSEIFSVKPDSPATQIPGSIHCFSGRLLTFPNTMQHRVEPFELEDMTQPGHRKLLALYLVDPHVRVLSTGNVPPQRRDWWNEHLERSGMLKRLPKELVAMMLGEEGAAGAGKKDAKAKVNGNGNGNGNAISGTKDEKANGNRNADADAEAKAKAKRRTEVPFGFEEAKRVRGELMEERARFAMEQDLFFKTRKMDGVGNVNTNGHLEPKGKSEVKGKRK